jgi:hypothetical protein
MVCNSLENGRMWQIAGQAEALDQPAITGATFARYCLPENVKWVTIGPLATTGGFRVDQHVRRLGKARTK